MTARVFVGCLGLLASLLLGMPEGGAAQLVSEGSPSGGLVVEGAGDLPVHDVYGVTEQFGAVLLPPVLVATAASPGPDVPVTRLTVHLEKQNPSTPPREAVVNCITLKQGTDVRVTVYVGTPTPVESWLREIVRGLLYRRAAMLGARYAEGEDPPVLPYWIVEGAYQTVTGRNEELFKAISRRARANGKIPLVETVIGWEDTGEGLYPDSVMRGWRGAFSWALYLFYQTAPNHRGELDKWFASLPKGDAPIPAGKAVEREWVEFQKSLAQKREDLVYPWDLYSWDRSRSEVEAMKTISFPAWAGKADKPEKKEKDAKDGKEAKKDEGSSPPSTPPPDLVPAAVSDKEAKPVSLPPVALAAVDRDKAWEAVTLPLADLPKEMGNPHFIPALRDRIDRMIVLEMRANFAWRPVIGLYRDALSTLLGADPVAVAAYPLRLANAATAEERLGSLAGRMTDYVNWFEVNRRSGGEASQGVFGGYLDLMGRFDAMNAAAETGP